MTYGSSWARRLSALAHFSAEDQDALAHISESARHRRVDRSFIEGKDAANSVLVMVEGLACKSRLLEDGRRQILSHLLPGDMTNPDQLFAPQCAQALTMLIPSKIFLLNRGDMDALRLRPNISDALCRYSLVKEAITSEWQVNVGSRTAMERVAHLVCEMYARLDAIGHADKKAFRLSLTQAQIAESVALSGVHVNRVLMSLRQERVIAMGNGMMLILDYPRLCSIAGFDPAYLKIELEPAEEESGMRMPMPRAPGSSLLS